jgi:hypothetical protein
MGNIVTERYESHHPGVDFMKVAPPFFPDLLERFMNECGNAEHWITVQEFRTRMSLDISSAHAIAGFLRRLRNNHSTRCRYTVVRIENVKVDRQYRRIIRRYLIRERPVQRRGCAGKMPELRDVSGTTVKSR